jgi:hypothetical protein
MDDASTTAKSMSDVAHGHMPPFITAAGIAEKLNWAPSLQRLFRQHVQSHPVSGWFAADEDLYVSICELLRLPGGLASFESRVARFVEGLRNGTPPQ